MPTKFPAENDHAGLRRIDDPPPPPPPLTFSSLDTLALRKLVSTDPVNVIEYARSLAEALAGPERDAVRLRTLARLLAVAKAQQSLLEALLMARLADRDADGVELVERALKSVSSRLVKVAEAHRLESNAGRRPTVVVAHADAVNVEGGG